MSNSTRPSRSPVARWISKARFSWSGVTRCSLRSSSPSCRRRRAAGEDSTMRNLRGRGKKEKGRGENCCQCWRGHRHFFPLPSSFFPFPLLLDVDDAQQFVDGRDAFQHLEDTIIGQGLHPLRDRLITDLGRRTTLQDNLPDWLADRHKLKDAQAALVACALAAVAPAATVEDNLLILLRLQSYSW